jgi:hypothetical protein
MRRAHFVRGGFLGIVLLVLSMLSCGKVTQETTLKKEVPSFNLTYTIDVADTQLDESKVSPNVVALANEFSVRSGIYGSVSAYIKEGATKELSWGKAIIEIKQLDLASAQTTTTSDAKESGAKYNQAKSYSNYGYSSNNYSSPSSSSSSSNSVGPIVKSRAFNKQGREITGSKHTWTSPTYNKGKSQWDIHSKKVLKGYLVYSVSVFDDNGHYRFKLIDHEMVSGNSTVNAKEISKYDTFISIIGMKFLEGDSPSEFELGELMKLYDLHFYGLMDYSFPENLISKFDYENPLFQFNRPLETVLLTLYQLFIVDPADAIHYLDGLEGDFIGKSAQAYLKTTIEKAKIAQDKE